MVLDGLFRPREAHAIFIYKKRVSCEPLRFAKMDYDDDNCFVRNDDYDDADFDTSLITVKEEEDEEQQVPFADAFKHPHPINSKRTHFVEHTPVPASNASAVRPEYTKIDKIAFYNHVSLLCLMHGQAEGEVTEPIVFDVEEQRLRETRRIKFNF